MQLSINHLSEHGFTIFSNPNLDKHEYVKGKEPKEEEMYLFYEDLTPQFFFVIGARRETFTASELNNQEPLFLLNKITMSYEYLPFTSFMHIGQTYK